MAVLFGTAAVADLLVDVLGHGSEGPGVLGCLSAMLVAVVIVHRVWNRHTTSPPRRGRARSEPADSADLVSPSEVHEPESAEVGALWRLRTSVEDTPGRLAVLAGALAAAGANILTLQVHPTGSGATDEFLVRTPPGTPADTLTAAVRAVGGGEPWVGRAEVQALADPTARALVLARQLLSNPGMGAETDSDSDLGADGETEAGGRLLAVLAELLDAGKAEWCTCTEGAVAGGVGAAEGADCDSLRLAVPGCGILQITRPGLPFTPAECARARAMAELATASARTEPSCEQS
jgi:ACT domain